MADGLEALSNIPGVHIGPGPGAPSQPELEPEPEVYRRLGDCRHCDTPIPEHELAQRQRADYIFWLKDKGLLQPNPDACDHCIQELRSLGERCDMIQARVRRELSHSQGSWTVFRVGILEALDTAQLGASARDYKLVGQYAQGVLDALQGIGPWKDTDLDFDKWLTGIAEGNVEIWGD